MRDETAFSERLLEEVFEELREERRSELRPVVGEQEEMKEVLSLSEESLMSGGEAGQAALPERARVQLRGLLDAFAQAQQFSGDVEEGVLEDVLAEREEGVLGLGEPEEEGADVFWMELGQLKLPDWIGARGEIHLPVASTQCSEVGAFDFIESGGRLSCDIFLELEDRKGLLRIKWKADSVAPGGWWFAAFVGEEVRPSFDDLLGTDAQGEVVFDAELLGFDPANQAFRYLIYPREE